jgi:hypothetical protein
MKRLFIVLGLLSTWGIGFCGLQDAYSMSGIDGRNPPFLQRVIAAMVTAAINVVSEATNDVQTVTITGTPTGGTFTLNNNGAITAPILFNATAGTVQLALGSNTIVTGGPGPGTPYTVTFVNAQAATPEPVITSTSAFTGGSSPAVSITHTTVGLGFVNHTARLNLARLILKEPLSFGMLFALAAATNATLQTDFPAPSYAQSGSVTTATADNDIQFVINSLFNSFI